MVTEHNPRLIGRVNSAVLLRGERLEVGTYVTHWHHTSVLTGLNEFLLTPETHNSTGRIVRHLRGRLYEWERLQ
jgi:monoamine oxidase